MNDQNKDEHIYKLDNGNYKINFTNQDETSANLIITNLTNQIEFVNTICFTSLILLNRKFCNYSSINEIVSTIKSKFNSNKIEIIEYTNHCTLKYYETIFDKKEAFEIVFQRLFLPTSNYNCNLSEFVKTFKNDNSK